MNNNRQRKPQSVGYNVHLATLYLLVAIYATVGIYIMRGLDAAGIYYSETRTFVPSCRIL